MAAARPQVSVQLGVPGDKTGVVALPSVFLSPIRPDVVHYVHTRMAKNRRQAYAVMPDAGMQHSAHSWGTGRAMARIPRVSGSGTSRAGQAAFGNMCRKGRMFAPTKVWRKWHQKINVNQKRYAVASALAASAVPALVMARGHRIAKVRDVPLVVSSGVESLTKTKDAVKALTRVAAYRDVQKAAGSLKLRAGKGKLRGRRYTQRRGPLIIYNEDKGLTRAFRNLPGVELCQVERLNLLQLAPGAHLGRFVVWTEGAFKRLDEIWGSATQPSQVKKDYRLPRHVVTNADLGRIINSDEVQSKLRPVIKTINRYRLKKNGLKNWGTRVKLNPYAAVSKRLELRRQVARQAVKARREAIRAAGKKPTKRAVYKNRIAFKKAHGKTKKATFARINAD